MVRRALVSSLALPLALALAACGGRIGTKYPEPTACQKAFPETIPYDGSPAQPGTVAIVEPAPAADKAGQAMVYEVDPKARKVVRALVGNPEDILKSFAQAITNPRDNAGTVSIIRNPPPPPDPPIQDHLRDLVGLAVRVSSPQPTIQPCQQPL